MRTHAHNRYTWLLYILTVPFIIGCNTSGRNDLKSATMTKTFIKGSFGYDADFLAKHSIETVILKDSSSGACVMVAPGLQGRVMTSSADGENGLSFGWINYRLFDSAKVSDQFNPYGGEERLWLGPEGGPFSIYFKKGTSQVFENWKVPPALDTEPFEIAKQEKNAVSFKKDFVLDNYSGTPMTIGIERTVKIFSRDEIEKSLGITTDSSVKAVAYQSGNVLINKGSNDWKKEYGFLSVWILSMFNPSEKGVVFIPFKPGSEKDLGVKVHDDYFGKVPADRLKIGEDKLFFKVDGKQRGKIGIPPMRALPYCGSYDPEQHVLTVLWYSKPDKPVEYVNSKWGEQDNPLKGDVINSYNDGPVEDGSVMGPFFEIESSSPAALLNAGDSIKHIQRVFHFTGPEEKLNLIAVSIFGVSLSEVKTAFN
ncbi:MAG TPA: DUF6786 family protein [Bacteroidales bacterium]|nr:DUF6786 family protein [Bacteroidales bacterium]